MNPGEFFTPFIPTTYNIPEEEDRIRSYLGEEFSNFADVINDKKIGVYVQGSENYNGEKWLYNVTQITRTGYQTLVYIPSYPATGALTFTLNNPNPLLQYPIQNVDANFVVTQVWGSASKPPTTPGTGDYFSFFGQGNSKISFTFSDTTIVVTTTQDMSAYSGFIIAHYIRNGV
jgi:hypothetical protein